jgi:hypothetical protein
LPTVDGLFAETATGGFSPTVLDLVCFMLAAAAVAAYLFLAMKLVFGFDYDALVDGGISCLYTLGEATGLVEESCRFIEFNFLVCFAEPKAVVDLADAKCLFNFGVSPLGFLTAGPD